MGNSDHSNPKSRKPAISLTAAAPLWHAFVRDYTNGWPVTSFKRPGGVVRATIDAWTGGKPGPWTRDTTTEWFIAGTQPGARKAIDPDGLLYSATCGSWRVDPLKAELGPSSWDADVADWASARPGRSGPDRPVRLADGLLLGPHVVGRAARRVMCSQALLGPRHEQRSRAGRDEAARDGTSTSRRRRPTAPRHRPRRRTSPGRRPRCRGCWRPARR